METRWVGRGAARPGRPAAHLDGVDGILIPGRLRRSGHPRQGRGDPVRARSTRCRSSASASASSARSIEFARHVAGLSGANSAEFDAETPHPVIDILPEQRTIEDKGGTMRLGLYPIALAEDSLAARDLRRARTSRSATGTATRSPTQYRKLLEKNGFRVSGVWPREAASSRSWSRPITLVRGRTVPPGVPVAPLGAAPLRRLRRSGSAPRSPVEARSPASPAIGLVCAARRRPPRDADELLAAKTRRGLRKRRDNRAMGPAQIGPSACTCVGR